jgi:hypothetical protein
VIVTKASYPTKNLEPKQIEILKKIGKDQGYDCELDSDIKGASLVMGVESYKLFEAAYQGCEVKLVPTGLGTRLYKTCYPNLSLVNT